MSVSEEEDCNVWRMNPRIIFAKICDYINNDPDAALTIPQFIQFCNKAGINVKKTQLYKWTSDYRSKGTIGKDDKTRARKKILTESQIMIFCGYVLEKYDMNKPVQIVDVKSWIKQHFNLELSITTIRRYLLEAKISFKTIVDRGPDLNMSRNARNDMHLNFINQLKDQGLWENPNTSFKNIICIDFAYNSQQNITPKTLAPIGATSPKAPKRVPVYTNCFAIANKPNGDSLSTLMFTYNPIFNVKNVETSKNLKKQLNKFGIEGWRIVYLQPKSNEKYCRETKEITAKAFELWARELNGFKNCTFLSDNGAAFKIGKDSIFLKKKAKKHLYLPSEAHAHISTCDNGVNFPAKTRWRAAAAAGKISMNIEPESSLFLLKEFDSISKESIKGYWNRNFQIDEENVTVETIAQAVQNSSYKYHEYHMECREIYKDFMELNYVESKDSTREKRNRDTGLDGRFWSKKQKNAGENKLQL